MNLGSFPRASLPILRVFVLLIGDGEFVNENAVAVAVTEWSARHVPPVERRIARILDNSG